MDLSSINIPAVLYVVGISLFFGGLIWILTTHDTPQKRLRRRLNSLDQREKDRKTYQEAAGRAYAVTNYPLTCLRDYDELEQEILAMAQTCSSDNQYRQMTENQTSFVISSRQMQQLRGMTFHPKEEVAAARETLGLKKGYTEEQLEEAIERHRRVTEGVNPRVTERHVTLGEKAYVLLQKELTEACTWDDVASGRKGFPSRRCDAQ